MQLQGLQAELAEQAGGLAEQAARLAEQANAAVLAQETALQYQVRGGRFRLFQVGENSLSLANESGLSCSARASAKEYLQTSRVDDTLMADSFTLIASPLVRSFTTSLLSSNAAIQNHSRHYMSPVLYFARPTCGYLSSH